MDYRNVNIEQLRKKHPRLTYESFVLERLEDSLKIRFSFKLEPDIIFLPAITIESVNRGRLDSLGGGVVENLAFHLGLIEMLSYWKTACPPEVVIKAGWLEPEQVMWWKDLWFHGMGEFFYANGIDFRHSDFLKILIPGRPQAKSAGAYDLFPATERSLVLVSGGKDSALTVKYLRERGKEFNCLFLNPTLAAKAVAARGGCFAPITVRRTLDPGLLELNQAGYLNGHTPFSALLAVLGVTCAALFSYDSVIVSNERSCDENNVMFLGMSINHQYSKTLRFENMFRQYSHTYLSRSVSYFSMLRPLYEIQVSRLFAECPQYFAIFKSCNRGQRDDLWCRRCAKCLSVFITLYPFLPYEDMVQIFGEDLFEWPDVIPILQALLGMGKPKPFECVGTRDEILAALYLSIERVKTQGGKLPFALRYVEAEVSGRDRDLPRLAQRVLSSWSDSHNLPDEYVTILKKRLYNNHDSL